ncbi:tryptophan--tRNA ligase [Kroppenstedtia eburnea]|uniref:Tryptophan--tRNA ligase n=1 Tax=Kroppenstedtia eburnea TaxID=714067 RepID=A0A1N7KXY3_9BACL|nr:tryptophan--tRNA ligase [Kroppenstedtia eburnea]QKI82755.1 tryptophan--tRNA ligase [Kroppenstedtia eburnea]SIS66479.1 tryptophanyl-tRNA synthetase [Kroppenstedtia eburnea]
MKRVFSGMQPTGDLHLGNYIGALKRFIPLQEEAECFFCVVDLHALTVPRDPEELRSKTLELAGLYLAAGLDPERSALFVQSHNPAHSEGAWLLQCITRMGELGRMTQFKDKGKGSDSATAGLFSYPVLMAADILLYQADLVPVGEDQKQHLELTRDLADRFNRIYGEVFKIPEPQIGETGARIMALDNPEKKMSKSADSSLNSIQLLDDPDLILKKFKRAVTDSENRIRYDRENKPGISNLLDIHSVMTGESVDSLVERYRDKGYGHLKIDTAEAVIQELKPLQERFRDVMESGEVQRVLARGAERAREVAGETLSRMQQAMGLVSK